MWCLSAFARSIECASARQACAHQFDVRLGEITLGGRVPVSLATLIGSKAA
jgi:hypothetical protein